MIKIDGSFERVYTQLEITFFYEIKIFTFIYSDFK